MFLYIPILSPQIHASILACYVYTAWILYTTWMRAQFVVEWSRMSVNLSASVGVIRHCCYYHCLLFKSQSVLCARSRYSQRTTTQLAERRRWLGRTDRNIVGDLFTRWIPSECFMLNKRNCNRSKRSPQNNIDKDVSTYVWKCICFRFIFLQKWKKND